MLIYSYNTLYFLLNILKNMISIETTNIIQQQRSALIIVYSIYKFFIKILVYFFTYNFKILMSNAKLWQLHITTLLCNLFIKFRYIIRNPKKIARSQFKFRLVNVEQSQTITNTTLYLLTYGDDVEGELSKWEKTYVIINKPH